MLKILWFVLVALGAASWIVHGELLMLSWRFPLLGLLCFISMIVAFAIALMQGFAWRPTLLVIAVFVAGQWWPILFAATLFLWNVNGFAP